jgi:hypothetical protein
MTPPEEERPACRKPRVASDEWRNVAAPFPVTLGFSL